MYVHGYSVEETERLHDQARALVELLHHDTHYEAGDRVLEVGCGVGAQSVVLAEQSPAAHFTSIDVSAESLAQARQKIEAAGLQNVKFEQRDLFDVPYKPESFDHVFVCFVLEHLSRPREALSILKRLLRRGGTISVIEGDHGSTFFHPHSSSAQAAVECLIQMQRELHGNALIGRELYPLLVETGFDDVQVSPRMVYVDGSRPALADAFTRNTFIAMVEGVRDRAIAAGIVDEQQFDQGISHLYSTSTRDGVFCYTFFKGLARKG